MTTTLNPYISLSGRAREALEFYRTVFGGELTLSTFGEAMPGAVPDDRADGIMHGQLVTSAGLVLMGSDAMDGSAAPTGTFIAISLSGDDAAELTGYFEAIAAAGSVVEPLVRAPWGDTFGIVNDQFGVQWMVNIAAAPGA